MTAEKVIRIAFSEITKVEVTCDKCGAGLILPVPKENLLTYIPPQHYQCPGCDTNLWGDQNDKRYTAILGLLRTLGNIQQLTGLDFTLSFSLNSN
jgi:hypothetical protein